jgi:DNA-binding GntR family transcriptional regulator
LPYLQAFDKVRRWIQNPVVAIRRIKREPAMTDAVVTELRQAILSGALPPSSRLTQEHLAEQLAVSRAPIRQALLLLEREGLVHTDRWRGAIVAPLDRAMIRDVYQFRGEIERFVAAHLATRSDFDAAPIRLTLAAGVEAAASGDVAKLIDLDLRFHTTLYNAVGNQVLSEVMRGQWTHIRRVMGAILSMSGYAPQVWTEHARILDAIVSGDADLAGSLGRRHTADASIALINTLPEPEKALKPALRRAGRPSLVAKRRVR